VTPDHVKAILRGAQCSMKVKNGKSFKTVEVQAANIAMMKQCLLVVLKINKLF
jgi:hypothetical protein